MIDIFATITDKKRAIWSVAVLLILYNLLRLIAVVAPLYVITRVSNVSNGISFAEYQLAFSTYISETSGNLQADPEILKLQIVCSVIFSTVYILSFFGLGMRKNCEKYCCLFVGCRDFCYPCFSIKSRHDIEYILGFYCHMYPSFFVFSKFGSRV